MTIDLRYPKQTFTVNKNVITLNDGQYIKTNSDLGKNLQFMFPQICGDLDDSIRNGVANVEQSVETPNKQEDTKTEESKKIVKEAPILLVEEPIEDCCVETIVETIEKDTETIVETIEKEEIRALDTFKDKDDLEKYGTSFGIDLNKTKKLSNMYKDLVNFLK